MYKSTKLPFFVPSLVDQHPSLSGNARSECRILVSVLPTICTKWSANANNRYSIHDEYYSNVTFIIITITLSSAHIAIIFGQPIATVMMTNYYNFQYHQIIITNINITVIIITTIISIFITIAIIVIITITWKL